MTTGLVRFLVYLALQFGIFMAPAPWLALPAAVILAMGTLEGIRWSRWAAETTPALILAALPAIAGFPPLVGWPVPGGAATAAAFLAAWSPGLVRSVRFLLVFASAAWLSAGMTPSGLRDALAVLLRPLGRRAGGGIARAASLVVAFLPWTRDEITRADEAARLRGSDPRKRPARHLAAMAVPVTVRTLEKATRAAEALALRDPGFGIGESDRLKPAKGRSGSS